MMMEMETRGIYNFTGDGAKDSVKYFDIVISHGYDGDMEWLAFDSAHKFGCTLKTENMCSFRHGVFKGEKAEEASVYYQTAWNKAFTECPEQGRRNAMKSISRRLLAETETKFGVTAKIYDGYYY